MGNDGYIERGGIPDYSGYKHPVDAPVTPPDDVSEVEALHVLQSMPLTQMVDALTPHAANCPGCEIERLRSALDSMREERDAAWAEADRLSEELRSAEAQLAALREELERKEQDSLEEHLFGGSDA